VNCKTRFDNKKKRDPYNFIKFTKLEPGGLTLLHKLTNVKSVIHGDGRDNYGFLYNMVGTSTTHVRLIMIVKIHFARNRHNFSTANIPCSKTEAGQQHLAQFDKKKQLKSHN
jgi:hypothetical protein